MGESFYTIRYGTDQSRQSVHFGIEPPLEKPVAEEVFEHISKHIGAHSLANHCELTPEETSPGSLPHTLITLHKFEGRLDVVTDAIGAKLTAMNHNTTVDTRHRLLRPDIGIGLFFCHNTDQ